MFAADSFTTSISSDSPLETAIKRSSAVFCKRFLLIAHKCRQKLPFNSKMCYTVCLLTVNEDNMLYLILMQISKLQLELLLLLLTKLIMFGSCTGPLPSI